MIVVAGEALIDLVPAPGTAPDTAGSATEPGSPGALLPRRGGGPYNTALALGRLGSRTAFCSRVSSDRFGTDLLRGLRADGVDTTLVQRGPEPTTLAVAEIGEDGSAGYRFYVEGTADRLFELPGPLPGDVRALSLGTCSLVLEPGAGAYEALLRRESARGVFTTLDPNIRADLITDPDAYRERFRSWLPYVGLLKLSAEDAAWLGGDPAEWAAAGPGAVVVTRGGEGLTVLTRSGTWSVPAERADVVDTIGAGDTVNAALLHRLATRHDALAPGALEKLGAEAWRDVLGYAARAAAVTCSRRGAQPPYASEIGD
ncbi:carbohydrate kinase family protein [Streptomyces lycii]|uniref:Carbohydrate kinase n=1 Tax=Streptomyces lycii TaxID=2654337 RepID=A0ABQ7FL92_9ACTN|nr:carbohydrate kinase [Streptomyces lycii]KAF4409398.1 carbohydrate kinase [Streptomyces lycii]